MSIEDKLILIAVSRLGVYAPQIVTQGNLENPAWDWSEVSQEDIDCLLKGPEDNEWYFEAWENAMNNIKIEHDGYHYQLMNNEDLWAVRTDASEDELEEWMI